MTLEQIFESVEKDLGKIDISQLASESCQVPYIFNKYHKLYRASRLKLKELQRTETILLSELDQYYQGKSSDEIIKRKGILDQKFRFKESIEKAIQSDTEYLSLKQKLEVQEEKVEALKEILASINNRQWNIRNAIEALKFVNGNV